MATPLPLIRVSSSSSSSTRPSTSTSSPSLLPPSVTSLLHRLVLPCQTLSSPTVPLKQRRASLKDILALLRSSPSIPLALSLPSSLPSFPALLDAALRLLTSERLAPHTAKPTADAWEGLRAIVDCSQRLGHFLHTPEADLIPPLIREARATLLDPARAEVCAPPLTHVLASVLGHAGYVRRVSAASLGFLFHYYALAYRAALATKEPASFRAYVEGEVSRGEGERGGWGALMGKGPAPPGCLQRLGAVCGQVLGGLIEHYEGDVRGWWEGCVWPMMGDVLGLGEAGDYTGTPPPFAAASVAPLLHAFTTTLQRHHHLLFTSTLIHTVRITASLTTSWPIAYSPTITQVKQAGGRLLAYLFSLQTLHPHLPLSLPLPSLTRLCLLELRRPSLFTLNAEDIDRGDLLSAGPGWSVTVDERTADFVGMCVGVLCYQEWRMGGEVGGEGGELREVGMKEEKMEEEKSTHPASSSPSAEGEEGASKRRKEGHHSDAAMVLPSSPLLQVLAAFSADSAPPLSHFYFLYLMAQSATASPFLFASPARLSLTAGLIQRLAVWMKRAKTINLRLWSLACAGSLASAAQLHADRWQGHAAIKDAWDAMAAQLVKSVSQDDKRVVSHHSLALLASLLHYGLVPSALFSSFFPLLTDLPRLVSPTLRSIASASSTAALKTETDEDDVVDGSSSPYPTPSTECERLALRFITACFTCLPLAALPPAPPAAGPDAGGYASSRGASSLWAMLLNWVLKAPAHAGESAMWSTAALLALFNSPQPPALRSFLHSHSSWSEVSLPPPSYSHFAAAQAAGRLVDIDLMKVEFDSSDSLHAVVESAHFGRLIPLPSAPIPSPVPPRGSTVPFALLLPHLHEHLHDLQRLAPDQSLSQPFDQYAKHVLRYIHLLLAFPPTSEAAPCLIALIDQLAWLLSGMEVSPFTLPLPFAILHYWDHLCSSFPDAITAGELTSVPAYHSALTSLSAAFLHLLSALLLHASHPFPTADDPHHSNSTHSQPHHIDGGDVYDFNMAGEDRPLDLAYLSTITLTSVPSYHPTLLLLYHALLALIKADVPLTDEGVEWLKAYATDLWPPFLLPVLSLLSLHDSVIHHSNLSLLLSLQRLCDLTSPQPSQGLSKRPAGKRKRGRGEEEEEEKEEREEEGEEQGEGGDRRAVEAVAFFLRLCECVKGGWVELGMEAASGVEVGEEEVVKGYTTTILDNLFPFSDSTPSLLPPSLSPLFRCLCCLHGLDAGLLSSWSLPTSLFPLLSSHPSLSSRTLLSFTLSSFLHRTTDPAKLWQSSSDRLIHTLTHITTTQSTLYQQGNETEARHSDELMLTTLGCLAALSLDSLERERGVLLRMCRIHAGAREDGRWVVHTLFQQMTEAQGYAPATSCPPVPPTISPCEFASAARPSLFTRPSRSLMEEHVDFLLIEWMAAPDADLTTFPFVLLQLFTDPTAEGTDASSFLPLVNPSLAVACLRYMPHVLAACLLHLPTQEQALLSLPSLVSTPLSTLLTVHFPFYFSWCYALYSSSSLTFSSLSKSIVAFLKRHLTDKAFTQLFHTHTPHLINHLLTLTTLTPHHSVLPSYTTDDFTKSLIQLSRQRDPKGLLSPGEWLCRPGEGCCLTVLLHVRTSLYGEYRRERQWRWMGVIRAVMGVLDVCLARGYVMRMLLDLLIHLLEDGHRRFGVEEDGPHVAVHLLTQLLQRVLALAWQGVVEQGGVKQSSAQTDLSAEELGQHSRYATLRLVAYADTEEKRKEVATALQAFLSLIPSTLPLLDQLRLLRGNPRMEHVMPAGPTSLSSLLSSFLSCFDDLSGHGDTCCMLPLVDALLSQLQQRKAEVAALVDASMEGGASFHPHDATVSRAGCAGSNAKHSEPAVSLPRVLAALLCLCRSASSPSLRDVCAQCLGEVGLVDPLRIDQGHIRLFQPGLLPPLLASAPSTQPTLPSFFSPTIVRWYQLGEGVELYPATIVPASVNPALHQLLHYHHYILYLLCYSLRSSSLLTQHLAFATLTALFTCGTQKLMQAAYQQLSAEVQVYLAPFQLQGLNRRPHRGDDDQERVMNIRADLSSTAAEDLAVSTAMAGVDLSESGFSTVLWTVRGKQTEQWLTRLVSQLLRTCGKDPVLQWLKDAALLDAKLAMKLLPLALMSVVVGEDVEGIVRIAGCVSAAIEGCLEMARRGESARSFLSPLLCAVQYVREQELLLHRQPVPAHPKPATGPAPSSLGAPPALPEAAPPPPPPPRPHQATLDAVTLFFRHLDWLSIADAACSVRWYSYALQWIERFKQRHDRELEVMAESVIRQSQHSGKRKRSDSSDLLLNATSDPLERYQSLLLLVYRNVDDPDGVYGALQAVPHSLSSSLSTDLILAEHAQDWTTALTIHDLASSTTGIARSLQHLHCHRLLTTVAHRSPNSQTAEQQRETAWRNAQWDTPSASTVPSSGFHSHLHAALSALHSSSSCAPALSAAREALVEEVKEINPELMKEVLPLLVRFEMINAVASPSSPLHLSRAYDTFDLVEPLLALHSTLLSLRRAPLPSIVSHLCHASSLARAASCPLIAAHYIRSAALRLQSTAPFTPPQLSMQVQVCHAEMLYSRGQVEAAIGELKAVQARLGDPEMDEKPSDAALIRLDVDVHAHLGEWLSESLSESAEHIGGHFERALASAEDLAASTSSPSTSSASGTSSSAIRADEVGQHHFALGSFHDRQFQALLAKKQSSEWQARRAHCQRQGQAIVEEKAQLQTPEARAVLEQKDSRSERQMDLRRLQRLLEHKEKEHDMDEREFAQVDQAYATHLDAAIGHYQRCLASSSQHDTFALYRFCALWFNYDRYSPITPSKKANLARFAQLPSYKFLPLIYQIASRLLPIPHKTSPAITALPETERCFRKYVLSLLYRMCLEHPHHSLYPLFALRAGGQVERVGGGFQSAFEGNNERIAAASHLLQQLRLDRKTDGGAIDPARAALRDLIAAMERLIAAYVELGNRKYAKTDRTVALRDTELSRLSRKELSLVAVPTLTVPVSPMCSYSSIPCIARFDCTFHFANAGINKPLILTLLSSDGRRHKQLLKPADDLRQDAVMEQLFSLVNTLLTSSAPTRSRRMRMRTYNVVPLTPGVGLVEWVVNTRSLHDVLVSSADGAHPRYHPLSPTCWSYHQCLTHMRDTADRSELLSRYRDVCQRFPVALHQHFQDHFPCPSSWWRARLTFIRSLSTTSIIGYLVGLGDRHIQNILIDSSTSEVIHIDLGVAFDMGRLLKTPEVVPFRLTRDLVDGMGVGGLEGGYRRGCEEVLRVMRGNAAMVSTLLEVFVYDPLFRWSLPPPTPAADSAPSTCLTSDHRVLTRHGWKYINDVKAWWGAERGDEVLSVNIASVEEEVYERKDGERVDQATPQPTTEWRRVVDVQSHVADLDMRDTNPDKLYRLQGTGMDIIATRSHKLLLAHPVLPNWTQHKTPNSTDMRHRRQFTYDAVSTVLPPAVKYTTDTRAASVHQFPSAQAGPHVLQAGLNKQPPKKIVIKDMEDVCEWWWANDLQLGFLKFVGFWLGDGGLRHDAGLVSISQTKAEGVAWLTKLFDEVFPHYYNRSVSARGCHSWYVICPPLYEFLRRMVVGPLGYNPRVTESLRKYPDFDYDGDLAEVEQKSPFYMQYNSGGRVSVWTQERMLTKMKGEAMEEEEEEDDEQMEEEAADDEEAAAPLVADDEVDDDGDPVVDRPAAEAIDVTDVEDEKQAEAVAMQVAGTALVVHNGGLFLIIDGNWFCLKRWMGPQQYVADYWSQLSREQAVALLEGFGLADGLWDSIRYKDDIWVTPDEHDDDETRQRADGTWRFYNSSFPLLDHLSMIGQLAGASVTLFLVKPAGTRSVIAGRRSRYTVDHWKLTLSFTERAFTSIIMTALAKPEDVTARPRAATVRQQVQNDMMTAKQRGYRDGYVDDGKVYDITVDSNRDGHTANFLTQRLCITRSKYGNPVVKAHCTFVGNCTPVPARARALYKWALSPAKLQQLRPDAPKGGDKSPEPAGIGLRMGVGGVDSSPLVSGDGSGVQMNPGAFRALNAVKGRLSGDDGRVGGSSRLSVEGQVSALIQQATSEENLSQMYWGWSAWV